MAGPRRPEHRRPLEQPPPTSPAPRRSRFAPPFHLAHGSDQGHGRRDHSPTANASRPAALRRVAQVLPHGVRTAAGVSVSRVARSAPAGFSAFIVEDSPTAAITSGMKDRTNW